MLTSLSVQVILASGYYAAFRVTLVARGLEGSYDGAVHVTTDYEVGRRLLFKGTQTRCDGDGLLFALRY